MERTVGRGGGAAVGARTAFHASNGPIAESCAKETPSVGESIPGKWMWLMCTRKPTIAACAQQRRRSARGRTGARVEHAVGAGRAVAHHRDAAMLQLRVPEEGKRRRAAHRRLRA